MGSAGVGAAGEREHEREHEHEHEWGEVGGGGMVEEERREEVAELQQGRFLGLLAHELRNALNSMNLALELMQRRSADPALQRPCALMDRQLQRVARLVEDLLDLSHLGRGKIELARQRLDLAGLARAVVESWRPQLEAAELTLELALPASPVWLQGDPARLSRALAHLLQNAIQFTDPGGQVGVRCWVLGVGSEAEHPTPNTPSTLPSGGTWIPNTAVLTIRDTGLGIEAARLSELFTPFAACRTPHDGRAGLGLGLALVKGLVELHGGQVQVESDGPGRGAAVTVWLPAAADDLMG